MSDGRLRSDLRITAGTLRGRRVPVPPGEVRPTSERARQAYFNIVADGIAGARFLDLFAGSGIFAFEALSRGAESAVAVDSSRRNAMIIGKTAARLGVKVETIVGDVIDVIPGGMTFDLVYADPPYDFGRYDDLLRVLDDLPLGPGAIVAVEQRRHAPPFTVEPRRLSFRRRAEYGEVWISFFTEKENRWN
ncbi:MAG TPA: 16S rRNA (guanine(966)-N(2))-methyltransferase RsmD [Thermoanaerobaculia bacterium]|nr:16S rRNA (guanine(966)-N(2))-methyltransferase RsmD [Thermoanaerobaculia bacterium]